MKLGQLKLYEKRVIGNDYGNGPLLIRWILFRLPLFGVYLHKLCRSDHDRALHDHPWSFISIVLRRQYVEISEYGNRRRHVGDIVYRSATFRHRVVIDSNHPSWTLVLVGPRTRRWGFWPNGKFCWWRQYNSDTAICEEEPIWTDNAYKD